MGSLTDAYTAPADPAADPAADTAADTAAASQEERRQRAVESLLLIDDGPQERFDRITRLARTVFGVPMSSITVLDRDRAWFPSKQGFDDAELPREETFCHRTAADNHLLVVEDAARDDRFSHLGVVLDARVRFYAGYPLRDALDNVVGTFCISDDRPRVLEGDQLVAFRDMAAWAQQELVASHEMSQAGRVQASMLPSMPIRVGDWDLNGMCLPALAVGGDFYDYGVTDGVIHLALGDVMGKGTGAALVGAGVRAALRGTNAAVTAGVDLGITATQVARGLLADLERAESFVTLFEAAIDMDDGHVRYVDAGMGLCLVVRAEGEATRHTSRDRPFGVLPDDHWTEQEVTLAPGDKLFVFSDGLLDLLDDPVAWCDQVADLVRGAGDVDAVLAAVGRLTRERTPLDDVTVVAVFRHGAEGRA